MNHRASIIKLEFKVREDEINMCCYLLAIFKVQIPQE